MGAASENVTPFRWTRRRQQAALDLAEDVLPDDEIAARAGVSERQLYRWKNEPAFRAKVEEHAARLEEAVLARGVALRRQRVAAYDRRWRGLHQVIAERAADPSRRDVPGGKAGLVVRAVKNVGGREGEKGVGSRLTMVCQSTPDIVSRCSRQCGPARPSVPGSTRSEPATRGVDAAAGSSGPPVTAARPVPPRPPRRPSRGGRPGRRLAGW